MNYHQFYREFLGLGYYKMIGTHDSKDGISALLTINFFNPMVSSGRSQVDLFIDSAVGFFNPKGNGSL